MIFCVCLQKISAVFGVDFQNFSSGLLHISEERFIDWQIGSHCGIALSVFFKFV